MNGRSRELLLLAALLLAGCDPGPGYQDDSTSTTSTVDSYPAALASPMFLRTPAQWPPYPPAKAAAMSGRD
jgi:hypothetical protein